MRSHPDDAPTADPEQDPAYRYHTLMAVARAGRLTAEGFRTIEQILTEHPALAEGDR